MPRFTYDELTLALLIGATIGFIAGRIIGLKREERTLQSLTKSGFPDGDREFTPTISTRLFNGRAK